MNEFIEMTITHFWSTLSEMAPYLLFGLLVAGLLSVFLSAKLVERHLGGHGLWPLLKASLFGVPLPLCSCGVIPVAVSLRKHGASKASTISFLLSTPQTGVDSFLVTFSLLGPVFAIFRPAVTFITGLIGGLGVQLLIKENYATESENPDGKDDCPETENKPQKNMLTRMLEYSLMTLPRDIAKPMLLGLIIAAAISVFVPADFFADKLGTGILAMFAMMLLGIPVYVCATASVPIAAAMIVKGLTPGAALVFLMTGPATNAIAFTTIWKILGSKTAIVYILTVIGCSLGAGVLLDHITLTISGDIVHQAHWMLPDRVKYVSAVVLLVILCLALLPAPKTPAKTEAPAD